MSAPEHDPLAELAWPEPPVPSEHVSSAIRKHCAEGLKPRRGPGRELRLTISALVLGTVVVLLAMGRGAAHPTRPALLGALGWGLAALAVLSTGFARPTRRIGRKHRIAVALAVPLLFLMYLALSANDRLPLGNFLDGPVALAVGCALNALLGGAVAASILTWVWHRTDPMSPGVSGALLGLVAGIAGAVGVGVGCSNDEAWHLMAGHGLGVVLLVVAGCWLGRRWLAP